MATIKEKLDDVYLDLNIRRLANRYFGKSGSWLYHKFDNRVVNHPVKAEEKFEDFSAEELQQLKAALYDFADRIKKAADNL